MQIPPPEIEERKDRLEDFLLTKKLDLSGIDPQKIGQEWSFKVYVNFDKELPKSIYFEGSPVTFDKAKKLSKRSQPLSPTHGR